MGKLENAITIMHEADRKVSAGSFLAGFSPLALLTVTLAYLVAMLSVPLGRLSVLLWFCLYPIIAAPLAATDFSKVFRRSLVALPFVVFIGIFNPIADRTPAFTAYGVTVTQGWISFVSIILRGLLSVQALLILISVAGFNKLCRTLETLRFPRVLTTQLMMVYRYVAVLLEETLDMNRARAARGFGRRHYTLRQWSVFVGQLFIRTVNRSQKIHNAMLARGFRGSMPRVGERVSWKWRDSIFTVVACAAFILLRTIDISSMFFH